VEARGSPAAAASLLVGIGATATIPVAIYATRFSDSYDLLHAAFAIPVAVGLGGAAVVLARRSRRQSALSLQRGRSRVATAGRILGILGLCLAASALVALGVYGLLEYVGSRN
jgi:ABC-type Fe3+ transport system permease subunit